MHEFHIKRYVQYVQYENPLLPLQDVYLTALHLMRKSSDGNGKVIDVGCGSGYKLVHYISKEFQTLGIETEPALSFLRKTYPNHEWINSGKPSETGPQNGAINGCHVGICADVIEHIR